MIRFLALLPLLLACAPVPMSPERAEQLCRQDLAQADGVSGRVGVGIGTGGAKARGGITVTNQVFNPQSEEAFLKDCIARKVAGEPEPTRFGISVGAKT